MEDESPIDLSNDPSRRNRDCLFEMLTSGVIGNGWEKGNEICWMEVVLPQITCHKQTSESICFTIVLSARSPHQDTSSKYFYSTDLLLR